MTEPATTYPDRVRLPLALDTARLVAEVSALDLGEYVYYSVLPLTTPVAKPGLTVTDYADGSTERIHLSIDLQPTAWVHDWISGAL